MIEHIKMVWNLIFEAISKGKVMDILQDQVWNQRVAVPVEMNLSGLQEELPDHFPDCQFVEIKLSELLASNWSFATPSRRFKALRNLKRGWHGYALVKNDQVLGDIWCVIPENGSRVSHFDLDMLGISCTEGDAYAFDMLIAPSFRGKNVAVHFQRTLQHALKKQRCKRMYGFYWEDNVPAMWMHRMLQFKELPKRQVSRFFSLMKAEDLPSKKS